MSLRVESTGPLALIVDGGRFGVRHLGVTQGGAMDWVALGWANRLLGNAVGAAGIEIMAGGLCLVAEADITLALAGADLDARIDDAPLSAGAPGSRFTLKQGQRLRFGSPKSGLRAYLAVPGGVSGEPLLGSLSSTVREGLGGLDGQGKPLMKDDRLQAVKTTAADSAPQAASNAVVSSPATGIITLELVTGAQISAFHGASLYHAFNDTWTVDQRADRMGIRLTGPELGCRMKGIISEGIPLGAVQVPPDGQPIILMNDRQTIGGYPRLGALTPLACARLAQCQPGTKVRLAPTSPECARREHLAQLQAWR
ncbi:MAG: biotin-dependent carboxyltransferase family protein [Halomonas sp.]|uniref:5-oxoprolinase subunit C family protein n=1 Tax=Halomonas sp. TaxID=1486246 RepID=UPI003F931233